MRFLGSRAVGRALADDRLRDDQRRLVAALALRDRVVDRADVVAVHRTDHVPPVGAEPLRRVVGEPVFDLAVDRNAVVVVDRDQLAELPRAGQRCGLVRNAFHQAAVAEEHPGAVIDDVEARAVELGGKQFLRERHADRVRESLPERPGRRLDARGQAVLRMARRPAVQLPELHEFLDRQVVTRQVQQCVLQHRAVTIRKNEAVAVGPAGDSPGCATGAGPTTPRRSPPCPSACPDGPSSPSAPRPSPARGSRWPSAPRPCLRVRRARGSRSWETSQEVEKPERTRGAHGAAEGKREF